MSKNSDEIKKFERWEQDNAVLSLLIFFCFLFLFPLINSLIKETELNIHLLIFALIGLSLSIYSKIKLEIKWEKERKS